MQTGGSIRVKNGEYTAVSGDSRAEKSKANYLLFNEDSVSENLRVHRSVERWTAARMQECGVPAKLGSSLHLSTTDTHTCNVFAVACPTGKISCARSSLQR